MSYEKTLWKDNITVVDAENLNKMEDTLFDLSLAASENSKALEIVEEKLNMKSNNGHTHNDLASLKDLELIREEINLVDEELDSLKGEVSEEFKKYIDNAEIDEDNVLHLYSNGKLLKSIEHKEPPCITVSNQQPTDLSNIWIDTSLEEEE